MLQFFTIDECLAMFLLCQAFLVMVAYYKFDRIEKRLKDAETYLESVEKKGEWIGKFSEVKDADEQ